MQLPLLATSILLAGGADTGSPIEPATEWAIIAAKTEDSIGCFMASKLPGGATLAIGVWYDSSRERRLTLALQHDTWRAISPTVVPAVDVSVGELALEPLDRPRTLPSGTGFSVPLAASEAALNALAAGQRLEVTAGTRVLAVDLGSSGASFVDTMACAAAQLEHAPDVPREESAASARLSL